MPPSSADPEARAGAPPPDRTGDDAARRERRKGLVASRERLGSVGEPFPWLLGLAHNVAADAARRVDAERASRHLAKLPPAQRDAVYLRHFADGTFAAIGRVTGVPAFTAASRYRLGIGKLRRLMETPR